MANHGNRTPAERAIIYGMAMRRALLPDINDALKRCGARPLAASSYRSIVRDYVPYFRKKKARLAAAIVSPPTWSDLKAAP